MRPNWFWLYEAVPDFFRQCLKISGTSRPCLIFSGMPENFRHKKTCLKKIRQWSIREATLYDMYKFHMYHVPYS